MSVKEVLQSLVNDNLVDSERVGTSNYYWAFPSKAAQTSKRRLEELEKQVSHRVGGVRELGYRCVFCGKLGWRGGLFR